MRRRGPVPCETSTGCSKGHWKDAPDLTAEEQRVLDLFMEAKACGFASLPDDVKGNPWFRYVFGLLEESRDRYQNESAAILNSRMETLAMFASRPK